MSSIDWYFARENKQSGPVSSTDLKRLAASGEIYPDDLVWREGLTEWVSARNVRGLFEDEVSLAGSEELPSKTVVTLPKEVESATESQYSAAKAVAAPRMPARHVVDVLLDRLRTSFNTRFIDATASIFRVCGYCGLIVAMALALVFSLTIVVKTKQIGSLLSALVLVLSLTALQYAARKFCDVLDRLNRIPGGKLASRTLPDCIAVLSLTVGLAALLNVVVAAVEISMYSAILPRIIMFIVFVYLAFAALNPEALNISIIAEETNIGQEAIDALTFLMRAVLRLVPVAFGAGVIYGTLLMGYACYQVFSGDHWGGDPEGVTIALITAAIAHQSLIVAAALPFAAYLLFLLCSLVLDLCRTILILPDRFDKMTNKDREI